jgi:hypothetical protein
VPPAFVEALAAFDHPNPRGGPPAPAEMPWEGDFEALEQHTIEHPRVADDLATEVDAPQAEMFARRLEAVDQMLASTRDPTSRLLRVGLHHRLRGILDAPRPRALRVRALADFYYSWAGRHLHQRAHAGEALPTLDALVDMMHWHTVAPGLERATIEGLTVEGPVHVNVLRVCVDAIRLEVIDCRGAVMRGEPFADVVASRGAIAGVSGGFFLYSEPDIEPPSSRFDPVGLLLHDGVVASPPVFPRGALLQTEAGAIRIERVALASTHANGLDLSRAITRSTASIGPDEPSVAIVGDRVIATGRALPIPLNGLVVPGHLALGTTIAWSPPRLPDGAIARSGIAGGPRLLHRGAIDIDLRAEGFWGSAPPVTFSQDETGDRNLLPRLAAGLDANGHLLLAAVDGRNFERALGMTLADVAHLMRRLGCTEATNLDGGSSKRMVVQGETLDVASTEIQLAGETAPAPAIRPVHTGVLIHLL